MRWFSYLVKSGREADKQGLENKYNGNGTISKTQVFFIC